MQARRQARKTLETGDDVRRQKPRSNTCEGSQIKSAWLQYEPVAMASCLPDGKAFPSLQIRSHVGVSICCRAQDLESPNSDQPPARQLLPVSLPHSHIGNRNIETCLCRHRQAALAGLPHSEEQNCSARGFGCQEVQGQPDTVQMLQWPVGRAVASVLRVEPGRI